MNSMGNPPAPFQFTERLQSAAEVLGTSPNELISIKVRPIIAVGGFDTSHLSRSEYPELNRTIDASFGIIPRDIVEVRDDPARLYQFKDGSQCLYIEHETGPELICHFIVEGATLIGATVFATRQIIKLVNEVAKGVRGSQSRRRDSKGRFVAVSIEKRMAQGQKLIRQIEATAKATERAIKSVEELLK